MITVVGIGPGDTNLLINEARQALNSADIVYGSTRQLQEIAELTNAVPMLLPKKLADLKNIPHQSKNVVILASGDPLLYGIGNWAMANFSEDIRIIPGISAIQMMFHQIKLPMNNCFITSSHGKMPNFDFLLQHEKVAMVTDTIIGPYEIAAEILQRDLKKILFCWRKFKFKRRTDS